MNVLTDALYLRPKKLLVAERVELVDAINLVVYAKKLNRPGFCRHLGAMENGLIGGVYEQQAVHG